MSSRKGKNGRENTNHYRFQPQGADSQQGFPSKDYYIERTRKQGIQTACRLLQIPRGLPNTICTALSRGASAPAVRNHSVRVGAVQILSGYIHIWRFRGTESFY